MKSNAIRENILKSAKTEFMEKGFMDASMRTIAERAGYTTGMLYSRFADKDQIFCALVEEGSGILYDYFVDAQETFAAYEPERQKNDMHAYVDQKVDHMIDILYEHLDAFRLIVCKSAGSSYERYIDKLVAIEMKHTTRYVELLRDMGQAVPELREDFSHMISSALFNGMFEVVAHDLPKEDAATYIKQLQAFFNAGWDRILGLSG